MINKAQATVDFLMTCNTIKDSSLFFNFGDMQDNAFQVMTNTNEVATQRPFIDGSIAKRYIFTLDCFKSVAPNPVIPNYSDENLSDYTEIQNLIDWINLQGDNEIYPDFGEDCVIEKMQTLSTTPELYIVENDTEPNLAVYRITIQIDYIDNSKKLWR